MPFSNVLRSPSALVRRTRRTIVASAVAATSIVGFGLATASPASAADSSSCTEWVRENTEVTATVNFRTGPGTKYVSKGLLTKGTDIYWACRKGNWTYVKPRQGAHKGKVGWVAVDYVRIGMRLN